MDTVLVTGGAGYIGSHTCKALFQAGLLPVTYDNLSTGHPETVKWGPLEIGDLRDRKKLQSVFEKYEIKGVLHFAASALVIESMRDPGKYYDNNLSSSIALLETMVQFKIPYLVFSSTCATYGHPQFTPITEEHPQHPINPYGRSKLMVEQIIRDFEKAYPLVSVILRYFNAAGADKESEIGEDHEPETHIIPSIIQTAMGLRKELVIYGSSFPSKDGSAVRDYIHVEDLAKAHVQALRLLWANKQSNVMNLGTGTGYTILEIVQEIESISKKKIPLKFENKREGEPAILVADHTKATNLLNWHPEASTLSNLIKTAWKWHNR